MPGLGMPSYAVPVTTELGRRSVPAALLDLPGFGTRGRRTVAPDVGAIGDVAAQWVLARCTGAPVLVAGHSTGGNAALTAGLALQSLGLEVSVLLVGPVFTPAQRRLPALLAAAALAYRRDSPRQLADGAGDLARGRTDVLRVVRSGLRDPVERRIARLEVPLVVVAGRSDSLAPRAWLQRLAESAERAPSVGVHSVRGSHNMPFTYPRDLADVVSAELHRLAEARQVHRDVG
ncbi:MAG TPA: alpha/beta hydrolase [Dermatophilaceae bacterium]|nr:alpha/beta hydrolase [Dermatophilaceae bacterium]